MIELVYIGEHYYKDSRSVMSPIYRITDEGYERYDYGFLQIALRDGEGFCIRQATPKEQEMFKNKLEEVKIKWGITEDSPDMLSFDNTEDLSNAVAEVFGGKIHKVGFDTRGRF